MSRCQHREEPWPSKARCTADATHYLRDEDGKRVPGVWCEGHAREIVTEYSDKPGWNWTMVKIPKEEL